MSLIYSGYFKGKPSTKERRTSKSSGVILIVGTFIKYYKISQLIHTQIIAN